MDSRAQLYPTLVAVSLTAVAFLTFPASAAAASPVPAREPRLSLASPSSGMLVGGLIPVTAAFDAGRFGKVTRVELWVNDLFYSGAPVEGTPARGSYTLDLDTGRLRNGQHTLQIRAFSGKKLVGTDQAVVTVSNGGADIVPPLVSFFAPLEGETLSGTATIGVNATDNDQVALVGISVNRMPVLIKSNPPFTYQLDTTTLPMPDGTGMITLEAMAIDRAHNIGKAKPIRVRVSNPVNATPLQADPPDVPDAAAGNAPRGRPSPKSAAGGATPPKVAAAGRGTTPKAAAAIGARPAARATTRIVIGSGPSALPKAAGETKVPAPPVTRPDLSRARAGVPASPRGEAPSGLKPALEASRVTQPPVPRRQAPPRSVPGRVASAPAAETPAPRAASATPRPTLMARAIVPPAPSASRPSAEAAGPISPAPAPMPAPSAASLSETRTATPPMVRPAPPVPPAPRTRPSDATGQPRVASLPRPATGGAPAPALEGGRLRLPVYVARAVPDSPARSRTHVVARGERLAEIARRYRVTPQSILVASGLPSAAAAAPGRKLTIPGTFDVVVDNRRIEFDVNPRVEDGLPIAPFRQIFEHAGGVVVYYPGDRSVKAARPDKEVRLKIGSAEALVNGAVVVMERPAKIDSGRTMVPVRFVTEALDMVAEYDVKSGSISLVRK